MATTANKPGEMLSVFIELELNKVCKGSDYERQTILLCFNTRRQRQEAETRLLHSRSRWADLIAFAIPGGIFSDAELSSTPPQRFDLDATTFAPPRGDPGMRDQKSPPLPERRGATGRPVPQARSSDVEGRAAGVRGGSLRG
ncbi:hypothetical protein AYO22_03486 [Fonsecaea multimorphosa]|nr:hypothetical protein AYO22_03486 [Fonsecaea multimorphosa]